MDRIGIQSIHLLRRQPSQQPDGAVAVSARVALPVALFRLGDRFGVMYMSECMNELGTSC